MALEVNFVNRVAITSYLQKYCKNVGLFKWARVEKAR
jgi:hypothetical protein